MALLENLLIVFVAALITDLATGLGVLPFFFTEKFSRRKLIGLWGLASGIMLAASLLGLIPEGLKAAQEFPLLDSAFLAIGLGGLAGVVLVVGARRIIGEADIDPGTFEETDLKRMILILGILTVHSFPEGVAIGVSFAELGLSGAIPAIAMTMTVAISIHNIPEGVAIAIPFKASGVSNWKTVGAAVFSSVPQPIGAVVAYLFVTEAKAFLPFGYGFAAGAMIFLVLTEFVSDALEEAEGLETSGWPEFLAGNAAGFAAMILILVYV